MQLCLFVEEHTLYLWSQAALVSILLLGPVQSAIYLPGFEKNNNGLYKYDHVRKANIFKE